MNIFSKIWTKIKRKWMKLRLQPIRVFCLHHVCEQFDADAMNVGDRMSLDEFKQKINTLQDQGYEFISLTEAYEHLRNDYIRIKKYAVLTFDDGYASLKEILPWLEEQQIPATLFVNGKYLDGQSYRKSPKEQYLTYDELFALTNQLIEIGSHGWEHINANAMAVEEFISSVNKNIVLLSAHLRYIPFHAYTYGGHNHKVDTKLHEEYIIPVLVDGMKNYNDSKCIHRELL